MKVRLPERPTGRNPAPIALPRAPQGTSGDGSLVTHPELQVEMAGFALELSR
jgi:hypothetical protein